MLRWSMSGLWLLLAGTAIPAAAQVEPPPPGAAPEPASMAPAPAPADAPAPDVSAPKAPEPPPIAIDVLPPGFPRLDQPHYGPLLPPSPALSVAMLEAGGPMFGDDPRVASAAGLLTQLTATYVEDAPRIAELTVRVVRELRAANQAVTPIAMMEEATRWKRPPGERGNIPRRFEAFARLYRESRKDAPQGPGGPTPGTKNELQMNRDEHKQD
jgi:hypothetical protein